jgi:hypothetical protein
MLQTPFRARWRRNKRILTSRDLGDKKRRGRVREREKFSGLFYARAASSCHCRKKAEGLRRKNLIAQLENRIQVERSRNPKFTFKTIHDSAHSSSSFKADFNFRISAHVNKINSNPLNQCQRDLQCV